MKIAVLGPGPIGSTFAFHLARAGHAVTVIARGTRLERLQADQAIVTVHGERAAVEVVAALDPTVPFDLVLVSILATQVEPVLPALRASAAARVMFMFNTFDSLSPLRDAVGAERFAFGFPAVLASLPEGRLKREVFSRGQTTLTTDPDWASRFTEAGIKTVVERDIESWLRTHAALFAPLMAMGSAVAAQKSGATWAQARSYALALREGVALVRHLGNTVTPAAIGVLGRMPTPVLGSVLWAVSRTRFARDLVGPGPAEPRALIDAMSAVASDQAVRLREIRP